jgi:hypothetical protein
LHAGPAHGLFAEFDGSDDGHRLVATAGQGSEPREAAWNSAAQNLTLVRKMALNLLKQDPTKRSIKNKRKCLACDEFFLERLLAALCAPAT